MRIKQQLRAKEQAATAYAQKVEALENQLLALDRERGLKLTQAKNKLQQTILYVQNDSIKFEAVKPTGA